MIRALASIGAIQVLIMVVALVRAKFLSTWLGPAGFGVMSTIDQAVLTAVQVSALSLPFMAVKVLARSHSRDARVFRQTFGAFLRVLSLLAAVTVIVLLAVLAWRPGLAGDELMSYRGTLAIAALGVPATILNILFVNTLAAAGAAGASAMLGLVVGLVLAVAAVGGALAAGVHGVYVGSVGAGLLTTSAALWYVSRRFGFSAATPSASLGDTLRAHPGVVSQAACVWAAMSAYAVTLLATRYAVLSLLGEADAGLLQAQFSLALTLGAVVTPMSGLYLTPLVNRESAVHDKVAAAEQFAAKVTILLALGALPLVLFPASTIRLLYSGAFATAAHILFLFVVWQVLYQIVNVYLQLLIGLDDVAFFAIITCVAYACALALFPTLISARGIAGAALGLIAAMLVAAAGAVLRLRLRFGHAVGTVVWQRAGVAVAAIAIGGWAFHANTEGTPAGIASRGLYALLVVGVAWAGLTPEERALVSGLRWRTATP